MKKYTDRSEHQQRVDKFMVLGGQLDPALDKPTEPSEEVRLLRAKLILEEALETIVKGLGVSVYFGGSWVGPEQVGNGEVQLDADTPFNMTELADGCADLSVVTTGTLSACGIADLSLLEEIDENNLSKFRGERKVREDGKVLKPDGYVPPDVRRVLIGQGWLAEVDRYVGDGGDANGT